MRVRVKILIEHLLCSALWFASAAAVAADAFPARPIRIVVNQSAGALLDTTTRLVAQKMSDNLGQPVIVENRAGADGTLGIRYVRTTPADGYTLLATSNTFAQAPALKLDPGYELKDFVGVGGMIQAPLIMVGTTTQPDKTLAEFVARAKATPNGMSFASGGEGTSTWMAATLMLHQVGVKILHVPYKGTGAAMPDVLAGRVNMMFDGGSSAGAHIKEGKLRAFGVSSATRMTAFPDIPTLAEQGIANFDYAVYLGLLVPVGTPKEVVQRLGEALRSATSSDELRQRFRSDGSEAMTLSPEEFNERLRLDSLRTVKLVSDLGIAKQ